MKKPGEFKKQQKKHQNIQHNRDQIKLLREEKITEAHLFVLDPDGFKKITIAPLAKDIDCCYDVVYLHRHGKGGKVRSGILYKDQYPFETQAHIAGVGHIPWKHVFGRITNVEMLKGKDRANESPIKQASHAK